MSEESIKHQTKRGIYWTFFNQFANNGLSFVVGIVMARLLSPSDYGITALPAVFLALANVFISSGFSTALIRKPELKEEDLSTAFYYSGLVGIICYILLFCTSSYIADFYNTPILTPLIKVSALTFLWTPLTTPQNVILNRRLDFKTPARISIVSYIVGAFFGIFLAYLGFGVWSLIAMTVIASFFTLFQTSFAVKWLPKAKWSKVSFNYLWNFGNKLLLSGVIDIIYNNITPIVVGKFYSTQELGVYNRAHQYASLPAQQGTSVIQKVTYPVLSKMQDNDINLTRGYRKMLKVSAFVIFPIMMLLAALARPIILLLITEKWEASIIFLQIMCFSMMWYPIHAINLNLLQVKGRSDLFLKLEIWKKLLGITVMVCTLPFGLTYFVAAGIVSSFISLFINTYYTGKLIHMGFLKQIRDLLPTYALSIFMFVVVLTMNHFIDNLWIQFFAGGVVGMCIYISFAFMFHFSELQDVNYMLTRK